MNLPHRKKNRLENFDYSSENCYFVTLCTQNRQKVFKIESAGRSLQDAMRFFKTMTTNEYIKAVKNDLLPPFHKKLWQKSYYDHIIRNEEDYNETYEYIENNPKKWILTHKTQDK